jgi:hypothetical protein
LRLKPKPNYRLPVSQDLNEVILDTYPILRDNQAGRAIFAHAITASRSNRPEEWAVLSEDYCRQITGIYHKGISVEEMLQPLVRYGLEIQDYNRKGGRARCIYLSAALPVAIAVSRQTLLRAKKRWDFVKQQPISPREFYEHRRSIKQRRLDRLAAEDPTLPTYNLLMTLNSQSRLVIERQIQKNVRAAQEYADEFLRDQELERYQSHTNQLSWMEDNSDLGLYKPCEHSARITAIGAHPNYSPREIRKILFSGCYEIDLQAAQLRIAAYRWDIPEVKEFIESGESVWTELGYSCNLDPVYKPAVKEFVYSLVYGMATENLLDPDEAKEPGLSVADRERLLKHPIIQSLYEARKQQYRRVCEDGYGTDAWGRKIPMRYYDSGAYRANSIYCQEVQSFEMAIMLNVLPVLQQDDVQSVSWLHDGLTVKFTDVSKIDRRLRQFEKYLTAGGDNYNIPMAVEIQKL